MRRPSPTPTPKAPAGRSAAIMVFTAALLAGGPFGPRAGLAQATDTLSASLLRRLAEAADAYRTGRPIWIVADTRAPHEVDTVLFSPPATGFAVPAGYGVYGPFVTPRDFNRAEVVFGCVHVIWPNPSAFGPDVADFSQHLLAPRPRAVSMCPLRPIPLDSITDMRLVVDTRTGTLEVPLSPRIVDAVFFSVSAFDKFVAPYYTSVQGPAYAHALRDSLEAFVRR